MAENGKWKVKRANFDYFFYRNSTEKRKDKAEQGNLLFLNNKRSVHCRKCEKPNNIKSKGALNFKFHY